MAIYLLNADVDMARADNIERKLRGAIPDLIKVTHIESVLQNISGQPDGLSYVLMLAPTGDKVQVAKIASIASHYRDRLFFILIGEEISASEYKSLLRTGGADWVSASAKPQELLDIISGARTSGRLDGILKNTSGFKPAVVSLVASAGGVGNCTLATEIGVHLKTGKATRNLKICIVDLDFQSSHVCDHLDIEPRLQIREISSNPDRLDSQLFDIFISRHSSGLHVFAAPRSKIDFCDMNVAALDKLFDMITVRYELILIDLPATWFSWTGQIIAASDAIVVTGMNTIPSLRQTAETLAAVREAARASSQIAIAVNRCERRLWGGISRRHHVESVLGRENVFYIAEDPLALESINTGTPMALTKTGRWIARDIAALAAFCEKVKSATVPPV